MKHYPKTLHIGKNFSLKDLVKCAILYNYKKLYLIAPENVKFIEDSKNSIDLESFWELTKIDFFKYVISNNCYYPKGSELQEILSMSHTLIKFYEEKVFNKVILDKTENIFLNTFLIGYIAKPCYLNESSKTQMIFSKITDRQRSVNFMQSVKILNVYLENALICEVHHYLSNPQKPT